MWEPNKHKIEHLVGDGLILDIGAWCDPYPRANYVIDIFPYETRGIASHGIHRLPVTCVYPDPLPGEQFTKKEWILHDICSETPFPFPDKMFDFVICSHTLEDVRDPLRACSEIIRVGKAGYIETPSRIGESLMSYDGLVGASHHRWTVEIEENHMQFRMKYHFLHTHKNFYIPPSYKRTMPPGQDITFLFWEDSFEYEEVMGYEFHQETREFIASLHIPPHYYWLDYLRGIKDRITQFKQRMSQKVRTFSAKSPSEELWTWDRLFEVNKQYLKTEKPISN